MYRIQATAMIADAASPTPSPMYKPVLSGLKEAMGLAIHLRPLKTGQI